jgi:hypothetical protein
LWSRSLEPLEISDFDGCTEHDQPQATASIHDGRHPGDDLRCRGEHVPERGTTVLIDGCRCAPASLSGPIRRNVGDPERPTVDRGNHG